MLVNLFIGLYFSFFFVVVHSELFIPCLNLVFFLLNFIEIASSKLVKNRFTIEWRLHSIVNLLLTSLELAISTLTR